MTFTTTILAALFLAEACLIKLVKSSRTTQCANGLRQQLGLLLDLRVLLGRHYSTTPSILAIRLRSYFTWGLDTGSGQVLASLRICAVRRAGCVITDSLG